jgi:3'-phosphoadenosine 5'-phosphosulfate (PAPS) 3'-phosphatase
MDSPLAFAEKLAVETGKHLLGFFSPNGTDTIVKEDFSVVTDADLSADKLIAESIQDSFPGDYLISEELQPSIGDSGGPIWDANLGGLDCPTYRWLALNWCNLLPCPG